MKNNKYFLATIALSMLMSCSKDTLQGAANLGEEEPTEFRINFMCGEHGTVDRLTTDDGCKPEGAFVKGCNVIYVSNYTANNVKAYDTITGEALATYTTGRSPRRTAVDSQCNGYSTGQVPTNSYMDAKQPRPKHRPRNALPGAHLLDSPHRA